MPASPLLAGGWPQRLRIGSGLVLLAFAFFHFLNHALGIWSVDAMETFQGWRLDVTRSPPGQAILVAAFFVHVGLNLYKIARRSSWRLPVWEAVQIVLGLAIAPLLLFHAVYMSSQDDDSVRYSRTLAGLWANGGLQQTILLLIVWAHGCIGLHFWLRLGRRYQGLVPVLFAVAVLVPALALAGFVVAGRGAAAAGESSPGPDALAAVQLRDMAVWAALAVIAALLLYLALRQLPQRLSPRIRISYVAGPSVLTPVGPTLLEISRSHGVAHTSVCGGRARCSTCRVKVNGGGEHLSPPMPPEAATLARIRAAPDVRLACQIRPDHDLVVTRLVRPPDELGLATTRGEDAGVERTLAVLFLDIRRFTTLSEARLPYDTVFLLNRLFTDVGEELVATGGWIDKYLGDGLMALFGLSQPTGAACRSALSAALRIDAALERLNRDLAGELPAPIAIGIGLHVGPLVMGRIGHRASAATTVIGPVVNVASRLESMTKEHGVQIVVSEALARRAGLPEGAFPRESVTVRGASEPITVLLIQRGADLAPYLGAAEARPAA